MNQTTISSEELVKRNYISGTPFTIVTTDEGSFITMGRYRLSDIMTEEEAMQRIMDKDWDLITLVVSTIIETLKSKENE